VTALTQEAGLFTLALAIMAVAFASLIVVIAPKDPKDPDE
jgi:hypothetical protein